MKSLNPEFVTQYTQQLSLAPRLASRCMVVYWLRQAALLLTEDKPVTIAELREAIKQPLDYFSGIASRSK